MERKNAPCTIYTTLNLSKGKELAKKKQASKTKGMSYFEMKRLISEKESKEKLKKEYEKTRIKNGDFLEKLYDKNREDVKEYYESNINNLKMSGINSNKDHDIDLNKSKTILLFGNKKKTKKLNIPLKMDSKFKLTPLPEKNSNKIDESDLKKNEAKAKKMREIEYSKSLVEDKSKVIAKPDNTNSKIEFNDVYGNYLDYNDPNDEDEDEDEDVMTKTSKIQKIKVDSDENNLSDYYNKKKGKNIKKTKKKCNKSEDNHISRKNKLEDNEDDQDFQFNKGDKEEKKVISYEINNSPGKNSGKKDYESGKGSVIIHGSSGNNIDSNSNGNNSNKIYETIPINNNPYIYSKKIDKDLTNADNINYKNIEGSQNLVFNSLKGSLGYKTPNTPNIDNKIIIDRNDSEEEQNNDNENKFGTFHKTLTNSSDGENENKNVYPKIKTIDSMEDSIESNEKNRQNDIYYSNESLNPNKNKFNPQNIYSNNNKISDSYNKKYDDNKNNNLKYIDKGSSSTDSLFDDVDTNKINEHYSSKMSNKNNLDINNKKDNQDGYNESPIEKLNYKNSFNYSDNNNQEEHSEGHVEKSDSRNSISSSDNGNQMKLNKLEDLGISKFNYELLSVNEHNDKLDHQHIFDNIIPDKLNNYLFVGESKQNKDNKYTIDNISKFEILNEKDIQNNFNEYQVQKIDSIQLTYLNKNFNPTYIIKDNIISMELISNNDLKDNEILKTKLFDKDTLVNIHQQNFSLLSYCENPDMNNIVLSTKKLPLEYYTKTTYIEPPLNKIKRIQKKIKKLFILGKKNIPSVSSFTVKNLQYTEASSLEILSSGSKTKKTKQKENEKNYLVIRSNSFDIAQKKKSNESDTPTTTDTTLCHIQVTEPTYKEGNTLEDNEDFQFRKNRFRNKKDYINLFPKTPPSLSKFIDFKRLLPNYVKNKFYKTLFTILNYKSKEFLFLAMDQFFYCLKVKINYGNINYTNYYVNADYSEISKIYYKKRIVNTSININNRIDKFIGIIKSICSKEFFYRFVLIWLYKNGININNKYVFNLLFKGFSGNKYLYTLNNIFQLGITNYTNLDEDEENGFISYIKKINDLGNSKNSKSDKYKEKGETFNKIYSFISCDNTECNNSYDKIRIYDNKNKIINKSPERVKKINLDKLRSQNSDIYENNNLKENKDYETNGNENNINLSNLTNNPVIYNKKILLSKNKDNITSSNNVPINYDMKDEDSGLNINNSKCNSIYVSDKQSCTSNAENNLKNPDNNESINNQEDYLDDYSNIYNNEEEYL